MATRKSPGTATETLMLERLRAGGEGDNRG